MVVGDQEESLAEETPGSPALHSWKTGIVVGFSEPLQCFPRIYRKILKSKARREESKKAIFFIICQKWDREKEWQA